MIDLLERRRLMLQKTEEEIDPYVLQPFTIRFINDAEMQLINSGSAYNNITSLKYNYNNLGWIPMTNLFTSDGCWPALGEAFSINAGDILQFIGEGAWALTNNDNGIEWNIDRTNGGSSSLPTFDLEGNLVSLCAGDNFATVTEIPDYALYNCLRFICVASYKLRDFSNLRIPVPTVGYLACCDIFATDTMYAPEGDLRKIFNGVKNAATNSFTQFFRGYESAGNGISAIKLPNVSSYNLRSFAQSFMGNRYLTWAELPSTTSSFGDRGLFRTFLNCVNLCFIDCRISEYPTYISNTSSSHPFYKWVYNVYNYGCFLKHPDAVWPRGTAGIPTNWEVFDYTTDWKFGKTLTTGGTEVEQLSHVITPWISISSNCTSIKYTLPIGNYSGSIPNTIFGKDTSGNEYYIANFTKGGSNRTLNLPPETIALKFVLLINSVPTTWVKESTSDNYLWKGCQVT